MNKHKILSVGTVLIFVGIAVVVIALAQGWRFDRVNNQLYGTGIIVVETNPQGANVSLNGEPKGTTNATLSNLPEDTYEVKVTRDGFADWTSTVELKAGRAVELEPLLVPTNPSLSPITTTPAANPVVSPNGQLLAYAVPEGASAGVWILDLTSQPFNLSRKPTQVIADTEVLKYSKAKLTWSPNNTEILATMDNGLSSNNYLLAVDNSQPAQDVSSSVAQLQKEWQEESTKALNELVADLPEADRQLALDHASSIAWSPSNLKFLYYDEADGTRTYSVYNKETESKAVALSVPTDKFTAVRWYADGQHLVVLEKNKLEDTTGTVSLMETNGNNKTAAFSGTLIGDVLYSFSGGAKLVILTSFNQQTASYYLYSINLR